MTTRRARISNWASAAVALAFDQITWGGNPTLWNGVHLPTAIVVAVSVGVYSFLLARRSHPLAAFVALWAFSLVITLVIPGYVPFAGPLLGLYAVASRCELRLAASCLLLFAAPLVLQSWLSAVSREPPVVMSNWASFSVQFLLLYSVAGAAWAVGRVAHAADQKSRALQKQHEVDAAEALRAERLRIASELHDSVSHAVTAMLLQAAGARQLLRPEHDHELSNALEVIESSGTQAMAEMHHMLRLLRSPTDAASNHSGGDGPQLGVDNIGDLIDHTRSSGAAIRVRVTGQPSSMDPSVSLAAYRVVQEALTNVIKHAGPTAAVELRLDWGSENLIIEVYNSTPPIAHPTDPRLNSGFGLVGLQERLRVVGGHLERRHDSNGFFIRATLPRPHRPRDVPLPGAR